MISIEILSDSKNNQIKEISIHGHSGYADEGSDIICSAVSCLTITIVNSLYEILNCKDLEAEVSYGEAYINTETIHYTEQVSLLLKTLVLGFEDIAASYPDYVSVQRIYT